MDDGVDSNGENGLSKMCERWPRITKPAFFFFVFLDI